MKKITLLALAAVLLVGCQTRAVGRPSVTEQMNALADLIGSAGYLRDHCGLKDIPKDKSLATIADITALDMGWDPRDYTTEDWNSQPYNPDLMRMGVNVEKSLEKDNPVPEAACQPLAENKHIAAFVQLAKQRG
ncbi:molecular chaperone [Enterobacter soli]|uniref:molecular chaperone n=1 Tax=Enterobacter soli TaxID=885040 RepID=UPI003ED9225B